MAEVNLVGPNDPNVLNVPDHTALGIDSAKRLSVSCHRWQQFFNLWRQYRKTDAAPIFAGRYFGFQNPWVPGELQQLRKSAPGAKDLRYIVPYNQPKLGRTAGTEAMGRADAKAAAEAIKAALGHFHQPEIGLLAPRAGSLFVFLCLDVNWTFESTLSADYWMGWSESLCAFDTGPTLLPSIYCPLWSATGVDFNAKDMNKTTKEAFRLANAPKWVGTKHRCHALATPSPWDQPWTKPEVALKANAKVLADSWPQYEELEQPEGLKALVMLWQYKINIAMTADVGSWQRKGGGPEISSTGTPNGKYDFVVKIARGGPRASAQFQYSLFKGGRLSRSMAMAALVQLPDTGVTLNFPEGLYDTLTMYEAAVEMKLQDAEDAQKEGRTQVFDIDLLATNPDGYEGNPITDYMLRLPEYRVAGPDLSEFGA